MTRALGPRVRVVTSLGDDVVEVVESTRRIDLAWADVDVTPRSVTTGGVTRSLRGGPVELEIGQARIRIEPTSRVPPIARPSTMDRRWATYLVASLAVHVGLWIAAPPYREPVRRTAGSGEPGRANERRIVGRTTGSPRANGAADGDDELDRAPDVAMFLGTRPGPRARPGSLPRSRTRSQRPPVPAVAASGPRPDPRAIALAFASENASRLTGASSSVSDGQGVGRSRDATAGDGAGFGTGRSAFGAGQEGTIPGASVEISGPPTFGIPGRAGAACDGCSGTGSGYGAGRGSFLAGRRAVEPNIDVWMCGPRMNRGYDGCGAVGDLDKAIIRKYLRRHVAKIEYCYERELLARPDLAGTVETEFEISGNGDVIRSIASGVSEEVSSCVAGVIGAVEFPRARRGGTTRVHYPFTFRASI